MTTLPAVITPRLSRADRQRLRRLIRARDGDLCCYCHEPMGFGEPRHTLDTATIEHVIPRRFGGSSHPAFLRLAHYRCNIWRDQGHMPRRKRAEPFDAFRDDPVGRDAGLVEARS